MRVPIIDAALDCVLQHSSDLQFGCSLPPCLSPDMAAAGFKFRNMGNSCFVNAGLQAVLALPGFASLRATTATERAVMDSRDAAAGSRAAVPRAVLDLYYRGRQEDCAEFLVEVLADCPSVHRHFRGISEAKSKLTWHAGAATIAVHWHWRSF